MLSGSMYEVSPDYGMITQAWNIYSFAIPVVQQFFGIRPQAYRKKVVIQPRMPEEWNQASLENVMIADNEVSVFYEKGDGQLKLKVEQKNPEWELEIVFPEKEDGKTCEVMESTVEPAVNDNQVVFHSKAPTTELVLKYE
ncbi:MAG: hypothetical protein R3B93_23670 [Bacteroidia bacterium]